VRPLFCLPDNIDLRKLLKIVIRGAVQGVGMRPFVARLAREMGLAGWVLNSEEGVFIEAEGEEKALSRFLRMLESNPPPAARIQSLEFSWHDPVGYKGFEIRESVKSARPTVLILPDIATCGECLGDVFVRDNRRFYYPFTNCTNCGPRFSIIEALPYDRPNTTMKGFEMCEECLAEYRDPRNRRYHAQPNACPRCGPEAWLVLSDKRVFRGEGIFRAAAQLLREGKILAIKGLGGFHLFCDARNSEAVRTLRERKRRYEKPLAVMFPSLDEIKRRCFVSREEALALLSPEAPIVLLRERPDSDIAPEVAPGNPYLGCFLPYTPLHHILMASAGFPCVATSGNLSDEPMVVDNDEAIERLGDIADAFVFHNRPIARRVDDSVLFIFRKTRVLVRRARGFAPLPVRVKKELPRILALGGHHKNTIALAISRNIFISQHIGDLDTPEALSAFRETVSDMMRLWEFEPEAIAVDMHPDYPSTRFGEKMGLPLIRIQHHHAHLASATAEHDVDEPVLGFCWDGTGWGPDGTVWGGEFLVGDWVNYERVGRFRPFRLLGGEAAIKEPARCGLSLLLEAFGEEALEVADFGPLRHFPRQDLDVLARMWRTGFRSPMTSAVGRLFDGVASILGIRQRVSFEGQTAMELEFSTRRTKTYYEYEIIRQGALFEIDWRPMIREMIRELKIGKSRSVMAMKFHRTLVISALELARALGHDRVFLSGGCFQNRVLMRLFVGEAGNIRVYWHQRVPPNDGGLCLGQAVIAGARFGR